MGTARKLVLIVDDEEAIRGELASLFDDEGFESLVASNGREALDLMSVRRPDLVLLDMLMPLAPGDEVLRTMSEHPRLASVPVFVITAGHRRPKTNVPVFNKPLRTDNIIRAAHAILDA